MIRTFTWFTRDRWVRYNIYFLMSFVILHIVSRSFAERERMRYYQERHQCDLIKMFDKLLKMFHDGILIVNQDELIYSNQ